VSGKAKAKAALPTRPARPTIGVERRVWTEAVWSQSFTALLRAAQAGQDGLRVLGLTDADGVSRRDDGTVEGWDRTTGAPIPLTGLAVLRRGDRDLAVLYVQGW
jgi:hypothetical protein